MATATLSSHVLDGALGEIFIDVRAGGRASARPAVVVVHGFKGFKDWGLFPPFAERLARAGVSAVSFNMSGSGVDAQGESTLPERFARDTYTAELHDLNVVTNALLAGRLGVAPPSSLGLVGHSRGGGIAILHAAREKRVRALVTWAAIAATDRWDVHTRRAWRASGTMEVVNARTGQVIPVTTAILDDVEQNALGLDILAAAANLAVPWLIVHGSADESVPAADGEQLANANGRPTTRLLVVPTAGHTFGAAHPWSPPVPAAEEVFDETLRFLAGALEA
jgi:dienelactone hydrolase